MGHIQKFSGSPRRDGTRAVKWRAVTMNALGKRISKVHALKSGASAWLKSVEGNPLVGAADKTMVDAADAHYRWFDTLVKAGAKEAVTRDGYGTARDEHLKADKAFAALKFSELTTPLTQAFLDQRFEATGSLDLVKRLRRVLVVWCDFAIRKGWLVVNIARPCKVETSQRPDEDEDRVTIPEKAVLARLLQAAAQGDHPERDEAAVRILMFGGLRISELLGLPDTSVALGNQGGEIRVRERLDRHYKVLGKLKSKKARRDIPIGPTAALAVRGWRIKRGPARGFFHVNAQGERDQRPGRLFPDPDGGPLWGYLDFIRDCWLPMLRRAGLVEMLPDSKGKNRPVQAFGPHALRHVAASLWISQNLMPKKVQELLGHSTLAMTMDLYGHLWKDKDEDADLARRSEAAIG
ncbi:tyrosine-type recombinase/integrase [Caulobacter sp. LARHSG274]